VAHGSSFVALALTSSGSRIALLDRVTVSMPIGLGAFMAMAKV
jgi:hypothetical protein